MVLLLFTRADQSQPCLFLRFRFHFSCLIMLRRALKKRAYFRLFLDWISPIGGTSYGWARFYLPHLTVRGRDRLHRNLADYNRTVDSKKSMREREMMRFANMSACCAVVTAAWALRSLAWSIHRPLQHSTCMFREIQYGYTGTYIVPGWFDLAVLLYCYWTVPHRTANTTDTCVL